MADSNEPIVVSGTTLPATAAALLRYATTLGLGFLVERGILPADSTEGVLALVIMAATVAYGLWRTNSQKAKLIVAADAAPNHVAVVK